VYQDVRGRWMSDGLYDNMRAYIPNKKRMLMKLQIHMILFWLKNTDNNNGNVGIWGSYPGFMQLIPY
jgi:predicted acyl esterase